MTEEDLLKSKPRKTYYCSKCGSPFHFQLRRNWFVKRVLFFLPVKKYFCAKCKKASYVLTNQDS